MEIIPNQEQQNQKPVSFALFGITGSGKSTFANTVISRQAFIESDDVESQTLETTAAIGKYDEFTVFVIDTPGLQDSRGEDSKHLAEMIQFIRENIDVQSFVFVINYNNNRIDDSVVRLFQLMEQMYPEKKWYQHIAVVWSHFHDYLPEKQKQLKGKKMEGIKQMIRKRIVPTITDEELDSIPQYFVDSLEAREDSVSSKDQIRQLLTWISQLKPLNESLNAIQNVNNEIMKEEIETERRVVEDFTELNVRTIITALFERSKKTLFSGTVLYSDWEEKEGTRLKEKKVLIEPKGKVIVENREHITILKERKQTDEESVETKTFLWIPRKKHYLRKGRIIQTKKIVKEARYGNQKEDGEIAFTDWNIISENEIDEVIDTFNEKRSETTFFGHVLNGLSVAAIPLSLYTPKNQIYDLIFN